MNYYETVYIIHPALQEGRLKDIVSKLHSKLEELKGEILYINNWGKKKLAYPIDKQKYGTYILCQYSIQGENLKIISQELELNPNILRYLITKIDKSKVLEGSKDLELKNEDKQNINSLEDNQKTKNENQSNKESDDVSVIKNEDENNEKVKDTSDTRNKDSNNEEVEDVLDDKNTKQTNNNEEDETSDSKN